MEHKPQRGLLSCWRVILVICTLIPGFVISLLFMPFSTAWFVLTSIWAVLFLAVYIVYLPLYHSSLSYKIEDGKIIKSGGAFGERTWSMPFTSIQYLVIMANPFDKMFAICSLVAAAPGGRMVISGLSPKKARDLADVIAGRQGGL